MNRLSGWRMLAATVAATGSLLVAGSGTASAQTTQTGLVNVDVSNIYVQAPVNVQVPIGVAANVCDVPIAVLSQQANTGTATCNATTTSTALNDAITQQNVRGGGGAGPTTQTGLVNVALTGIAVQIPANVQVPVGVAANVCDISAAVLATQANGGTANCTARSDSTALNQAVARQLITA